MIKSQIYPSLDGWVSDTLHIKVLHQTFNDCHLIITENHANNSWTAVSVTTKDLLKTLKNLNGDRKLNEVDILNYIYNHERIKEEIRGTNPRID